MDGDLVEAQNRWIHCDSCEASFDQPRLYSKGWGKKLSYVVAFAKDGVADVSARYHSFDNDAIQRRAAVVNAAYAAAAIERLNTQLMSSGAGATSSARRATLEARCA